MRSRYPMEIQENEMTPTYENDFALCKYELNINVLHKLQLRQWQFLQFKKRNMPIFYICGNF